MQLDLSTFLAISISFSLVGGFVGFVLTLVSLSRDNEFQRVGPNEVVVDREKLEKLAARVKRNRVDEVDGSDFGMNRVDDI